MNNWNEILKAISDHVEKYPQDKDKFLGMFQQFSNMNGNSANIFGLGNSNIFGNPSLIWNNLGASQTPSAWDKMIGFSQNGQNYTGWGGTALSALENIASAWQNYNQFRTQRDLARDQFNLQKTKYEDEYNNIMEDRRIRAASRASANS